MKAEKSRSDTAAEARYRVTLASIGDGVISTDARGRIDFMNPVAERLTGWNEAEAKGRPTDEVFKIVNEETRAKVESPVARVLREGVVVGLANHTVLVAKNGTERPIADSGAPIRDEKGEVTGVVLVFRDQTEERAAQRALAYSALHAGTRSRRALSSAHETSTLAPSRSPFGSSCRVRCRGRSDGWDGGVCFPPGADTACHSQVMR